MHTDYGLMRIELPNKSRIMKERQEQQQQRHNDQHDSSNVLGCPTSPAGAEPQRRHPNCPASPASGAMIMASYNGEAEEDAAASGVEVCLEEGGVVSAEQQEYSLPPDFSSALDMEFRRPSPPTSIGDAASEGYYSPAAAALGDTGATAAATERGFAFALDDRRRQPEPLSGQDRSTCWTLGLFLLVAFAVTFYFTVPWVPVLEDLLDWIDDRGPSGILLLFCLHQLAMYAIIGPINTLEYCWVFLRGWAALPWIVLSYILSISVMLYVGHTTCRPCIVRRVQDSRLMQATQRVLDEHPYAWYIAFQFWSLVPWRIGVYGAHVLAPHAHLPGIGLAVLVGQLPYLLYGIWLATKITDLDSLVTLRLDTPRDTAIFWASVVVTLLISLLLYVKIKRAFVEAADRRRSAARPERRLAPDTTATAPNP
jgi:uncharacterized membrane protein YdjX (TVP38/TMEM64 family)